MKTSFTEVEFIAEALEASVKENPYLFVPGTGEKAGMLGLNYFNIVHAVLSIKEAVNNPSEWIKK